MTIVKKCFTFVATLMLSLAVFATPAPPYKTLRIFDFDCTITVDESFKFPIDDEAIIKENTKHNIKTRLLYKDSLFAISSFIDAPDNIIAYLTSIFNDTPILISQTPYYLYNTIRNKTVVAFYISKYKFKNIDAPIYIINLPKRSGKIDDPETGEKNIDYHMAQEVLQGSGKNISITVLVNELVKMDIITSEAKVKFYDDNEENAQYASQLILLNKPVKSYMVVPHIKDFEALKLNTPGAALNSTFETFTTRQYSPNASKKKLRDTK